MRTGNFYEIAAFSDSPRGGNPAGVWVGNILPEPEVMQQIATEIGYSETVFVAPYSRNNFHVRYYSPEAEVDFCGHATIAAGSILGAGSGCAVYHFLTAVGEIPVTVRLVDSKLLVELTSVDTHHKALPESSLLEILDTLGWTACNLDKKIPPVVAYAGNWHPIIAVGSKSRLKQLEYDFEQLKQLMLRENWTTLQLIWREREDLFHARNPFPVGGTVEDPATGAAAAALGGYLRDASLISTPASFQIIQGADMGRPSYLSVAAPAKGGIKVAGTATVI